MGNEASKSGESQTAAPANARKASGVSPKSTTANPNATETSSKFKSPPSLAPQTQPQQQLSSSYAAPPPALQRSSAPMAVASSTTANATVPLANQSNSASERGFFSSLDIPVSGSLSNTTEAVWSSMPRYVDASSMVYTVPSVALETSFSCVGRNNNNTNMAMTPKSNGDWVASAPMPLPVTAPSRSLHIGALSSPLSPSRRHFPLGGASSPIAIPTYSTSTNSAVEDLSCSSPILRSYRQHSSTSKRDTCLAKSPTGAPVTYFGASSFNANPPDMPTTLVSSSSASRAADEAIHTKFLEITGHPLGLENYGNTCYCNSVIQLIYHCTPLRLRLLELYDVYLLKKGKSGFEEDTVLYQLCSLIAIMHKSNNRSKEKHPREKISPKDLLQCVRKKNAIFNNDMQQDAHEFTMFLINDITETEQRIMADPNNANLFEKHETSKKKSSSFSLWKHSKNKTISANGQVSRHGKPSSASSTAESSRVKLGGAHQPFSGDLTPLQAILQGQFGSLTACLECENITARDEVFIDLSLETEQGCSLLRCLDHFGDPEYFWGKNKLHCDECKMQVRAAKTIHVQQLPQYALLIHLKRFQYDVKKQKFTKKADHVALPMQMDVEEYLTDPEVIEKSLRNEQARTQGDDGSASTGKKEEGSSAAAAAGGSGVRGGKISSPDAFKPASEEVRIKLRGIARHKARFELAGFVVHIGEGPNSGHYFTCVRYGPQLWRRFDDDTVSTMTERDVQQFFGVPSDATGVVTTTAYILLYERVA